MSYSGSRLEPRRYHATRHAENRDDTRGIPRGRTVLSTSDAAVAALTHSRESYNPNLHRHGYLLDPHSAIGVKGAMKDATKAEVSAPGVPVVCLVS